MASHTVLVVGDDERLIGGLRVALQRARCHLVTVDEATAALRTLKEQAIDVVVCDERAPGVAGADFLAGLDAEHAGTVRIHLGAWAGLDLPGDARLAGRRVLRPPCGAEEIALAIRQALVERDLLGESRRLLRTVRRQSAVIEQLERELQGLAPASRDPSGAVALSDVPTSPDALVDALQAELEAADRRLREHEREMRRRSERARSA